MLKAKFGDCSACGKQDCLLYRRNPPMCQKCNNEFKREQAKKKGKKPPKPKKRIAPVSKKRLKEMAQYRTLRQEFMTNNPICQAGYDCCTTQATDVHHVHGRIKHYLDPSTWMAICRACHDHIHHVDPKKARELGHLK